MPSFRKKVLFSCQVFLMLQVVRHAIVVEIMLHLNFGVALIDFN
jgi:hypothetical protein